MMKDNILNVKIPPQLRQRILTTVDWFDKILTHEGGLVPSLVYMVTGQSGAGKSTLMRQTADGLTGNGHIVLVNSGEESAEQIAIGVERMELEHGFIYDNLTSHRKLLARLEALRINNPGKYIILIQDSVQKLTDDATEAKAFNDLKDWAKQHFMPMIIIFQVTKAGKFKGDNSSLHDADVQVELSINKKSGSRSLTVSKNRFGPVTDDPVAYTITKHGLELLHDVDELDEEEPNDESDDLEVGQLVVCNKRAAEKNRGKVGKVKKVGRTRVTVWTLKGEELYLPKDHVSIEDDVKSVEREVA